mgnify:FL=1
MNEAASSPVRAEIDWLSGGKREGRLRVPLSRNESGWGTVAIPVVVIANGSGPTMLFTAGNHGDEDEGQVALLRLAQTLDPAAVQRREIMLPAMHFPAARAGARAALAITEAGVRNVLCHLGILEGAPVIARDMA